MKKILLVASEGVPFIKTGGLADVVGALPKCIDREYYDVRVILPKYVCMTQAMKDRLTYRTHFYMDFHWQNQFLVVLNGALDHVIFCWVLGFVMFCQGLGDSFCGVREHDVRYLNSTRIKCVQVRVVSWVGRHSASWCSSSSSSNERSPRLPLRCFLYPCNRRYYGRDFDCEPTIEIRWRTLLGLCHFPCTCSDHLLAFVWVALKISVASGGRKSLPPPKVPISRGIRALLQ